jgi:RNA polymerase sigma-70 factor (ECF subfamily)
MSRSDERDLARLRAQRFDALYARHYAAIFAYVRRRLWASGIDEDDVVADVFAVVWRRLDDLPPVPEDLLWLYGVARRCVLRARRTERRRTRLGARLAAQAELRSRAGSGEQPDAEAVRAAIASLRARDREVLMLVMWEQLSHRDAAQVLGCSPNAVATRLHRAKERLRAQLRLSELSSPVRAESEVQSP